jgi:8-oxo-dGTP diphosphatase
VRLFVIRHVAAGHREGWQEHSPDEARPITKRGKRQADALAERLAGEAISRLVSSPYVRCVQSLEPLGDKVGLPIELDERLAEGHSFEESLALVRELPDGALICSHGDVVQDLITALVRRGMELTTEADWRKATLWVIDGPDERSADGDPVFTTAAVEPPPITR